MSSYAWFWQDIDKYMSKQGGAAGQKLLYAAPIMEGRLSILRGGKYVLAMNDHS